MTTDRPTDRLPEQQRWDWNHLQAERETERKSAVSSTPQSREDCPRPGQGTTRSSHTTIEQKEEQLQSVINRYERLLTEKNRQLANQPTAAPIRDKLSSALSRVLRWIPKR